MRSSSVAAKLLGAVVLGGSLFLAAPSQAADVNIKVMVTHTSSKPGPVERQDLLPRGFTPASHTVLQTKNMALNMGQEGKTKLPNGKNLKLTPTSIQRKQLMIHVEVEGATDSVLSLREGKRVTIRHPEPYKGGNLLVHLEARF